MLMQDVTQGQENVLLGITNILQVLKENLGYSQQRNTVQSQNDEEKTLINSNPVTPHNIHHMAQVEEDPTEQPKEVVNGLDLDKRKIPLETTATPEARIEACLLDLKLMKADNKFLQEELQRKDDTMATLTEGLREVEKEQTTLLETNKEMIANLAEKELLLEKLEQEKFLLARKVKALEIENLDLQNELKSHYKVSKLGTSITSSGRSSNSSTPREGVSSKIVKKKKVSSKTSRSNDDNDEPILKLSVEPRSITKVVSTKGKSTKVLNNGTRLTNNYSAPTGSPQTLTFDDIYEHESVNPRTSLKKNNGFFQSIQDSMRANKKEKNNISDTDYEFKGSNISPINSIQRSSNDSGGFGEPRKKCGYLKKQGGAFLGWKNRYIVVESGSIHVLSSPEDTAAKESLSLNNATISNSKEAANFTTFSIKIPKRSKVLRLDAGSANGKLEWVKEIEMHIQYANRFNREVNYF